MANGPTNGTRIQSVTRAMRLLRLVATAPEHDRMVNYFATALHISVPTTYHLLNTLVDSGMLLRDGQRRYHLGINVGVLASAYEAQTVAVPEMTEPLRDVNASTGESTYLSVWRGGEIEILAHFKSVHSVQVASLEPGFRGFAHARASGKVLLAYTTSDVRETYLARYPPHARTAQTITDPAVLVQELESVRRLGFATEEEEFASGVACLAVPVVSEGYLMGAYTLSCPIERYVRSREDYLESLRQAARAAEVRLAEFDA